MAKLIENKLGFLSIGISLASIHFGLGFLVGTGEAVYNLGSRGILYSISSALGIFSLIFIAGFYWRHKYPIWQLMGEKYGPWVYKMVAFLSGIWMVGVVASQILGGAWALSIFGINNRFSMILLAILIYLLTRVNLGKLSRMFFYMLMFTSGLLLLVLANVGLKWIPYSIGDFVSSLKNISVFEIVGILSTTVLITFLGMDFQQFIVRAKNEKESRYGSFIGGVILVILSFLLLSLINASIASNLAVGLSDPKQAVPMILFNFGKQFLPFAGFIFAIPITLVSIGSGSGVSRVVKRTIEDLNILPLKYKNKVDFGLITVLIALIIAFTGDSIINLIVAFYAIYVGSIFVPFLLYLLDQNWKKLKIDSNYVRNSIFIGFVGSFIAFIQRFIPGSEQIIENHSTYIVLLGLAGSVIGFLIAGIIHYLKRMSFLVSYPQHVNKVSRVKALID